MFFKDIVGQQDIVQKLRNSFTNGRLGHATLLAGKEGHGCLPIALAMSRYIMCRERSEEDACGECPSCKKFDKLVHPDVHFIFPVVNKKGKDPVSDSYLVEWRKFLLATPYATSNDWIREIATENSKGTIYKDESDLINRKLSMKSFEGYHKIMIIWMAEKMNDVTANKILKILEEPPQNTYFFLIAAQPEQLLQTILSRTQIVNIPPIDVAEVANYLSAKYEIDSAKATDLAFFAEGDLARSIELFDKVDELQQNIENFNKFIQLSKKEQTVEIWDFINTQLDRGMNSYIEFLSYITHNIRRNIIETVAPSDNKILSNSATSAVKLDINFQQARAIYKLLNDAIYHIERNVYPQLVLFDMSLQLKKLL